MNINVYLEDELAQELLNCSKSTDQSRNAIIRTAIRDWLKQQQGGNWPHNFLAFKGVPDFPAFEASRDELKPPPEDPLA